MASEIKYAVATRNLMGEALIADLGASPVLKIYEGTKPAGPGTAITTQTLIGTLTCSATPATVANGLLTFNPITQDTGADASTTGGTLFYRITTAGGVAKIDGTVGTSGCDLNMNTITIVYGGTISVSSLTHTMPGG